MEHLFALWNRLFAQDAATGSLPMLYAATAPDVHGGDYIGPDAFAELWGYPAKVDSSPASHDVLSAAHLWEVSRDLTGVRY